MVDLKEVEQFFFKAMIQGYANSGTPKIKIPELPRYKAIPFTHGYFRLLDIWCVNAWCTNRSSPKSAGMTTIWYKDTVVWVMQYSGWYQESVIPFLKYALHETYRQYRFIGGRGLCRSEGGLLYLNFPNEYQTDFSEFSGHERIIDKDEVLLGCHKYSGISMI